MKDTILLVSSIAWLVLVGCPVPLEAQNDPSTPQNPADPSDQQIELNNRAVRKIVKGDYAAAVALLEEALALGDLNVTYLNLGRAYQKLERCDAAERALDRAEHAPAVPEPSPEVIGKKIREYRNKLADVCASIESPAERAREELSTRATTYGQRAVSRAERLATDASASPDPDTAPPTTSRSEGTRSPAPEPNYSDRGLRRRTLWGWVAIGTGGLMGGGGLALHLVARNQRSQVTDTNSGEVVQTVTQREARRIEQRANRFDTYALISTGLGAAALGTGMYLLLTPERRTSRSADTSNRADLRVRLEGPGLTLDLSF